ATPARIVGSFAGVSYNNGVTNFAPAQTTSAPVSAPAIATPIPSRSTSAATVRRRAPSAIRTPISFVRCAVSYETTPDADGREYQGEHTEHGEHRRTESERTELLPHGCLIAEQMDLGERQIRGGRLHGAPNAGNHATRISVVDSRDQLASTDIIPRLRHRQIEEGAGVLEDALPADVLHDADDLGARDRIRLALRAQTGADRAALTPIPGCENLAENHHARRSGVVARPEVAATQDVRTESLEIVRRDDIVHHVVIGVRY